MMTKTLLGDGGTDIGVTVELADDVLRSRSEGTVRDPFAVVDEGWSIVSPCTIVAKVTSESITDSISVFRV